MNTSELQCDGSIPDAGARRVALLGLLGATLVLLHSFPVVQFPVFQGGAISIAEAQTEIGVDRSQLNPGTKPEESSPQISKAATSGALDKFEKGVRKFVLSNGLRVLFFKRDSAPVFAGQTWVKVGGVNETLGKTGAAHLLEHMAFKGSETIGTKDYQKEKVLLEKLEELVDKDEALKHADPKTYSKAQFDSERKDIKGKMEALYKELSALWVDNEFSVIYERQGESGLNAGTSKDFTMYRVSLPKVAFELWCWMESDRILHPVFRQFYKEREVVREERRMRTEDSPGGRLYEALMSTAYVSHPYSFPTVGWPKDILSIRKSDTEEIYKTYYRPDNMVISLVGDLDPDEAIVTLEKYFGRIPVVEKPLPRIDAEDVPQKGERQVTVEYDAQPTLYLGYHKPTYPNADDLKFSVLHAVLSGGRSSLLYRELVLKQQLAVSVATDEVPGTLYPSLFLVAATPRVGVSNEKLAAAIQTLLDKLQTQKLTPAELEAAKRRVRVGFLDDLNSNEELAGTLGESELLYGDWKAKLKMFEMVEETTADDIARLSQQYLRTSQRTFAHLERPKK